MSRPVIYLLIRMDIDFECKWNTVVCRTTPIRRKGDMGVHRYFEILTASALSCFLLLSKKFSYQIFNLLNRGGIFRSLGYEPAEPVVSAIHFQLSICLIVS